MTVHNLNSEFQASSAQMSQAVKNSLRLYLLPLVIGPLLIIAVAFLIVPTEWFARHSHDPWISGIGYGAELQQANCDVVIYGDSTAEVGVNPDIIDQRTGLKTCDISQEQGLIVLSGNYVLDDYLKHNTAPRFLILMYAAEQFNAHTKRTSHSVFEAMTYQMGHKHWFATMVSLWRNPEDFFRWAYKGVHMSIVNARLAPTPAAFQHVRENSMGWLPLDDLRLGNSCSDQSKNFLPDSAAIHALRSRYSSPRTTLLIDVMPLPDCDAGISLLQSQLGPLLDKPVSQLPSRTYFRGGLHVDAQGSTMLSSQIADQIRERMSLAPSKDTQ